MKKHKRRRTISAIELRAMAGRGPRDRGSALLIVIGTLALVAVFAAVYVSIGRTDRRAAQAFRTRVEQRDTSHRIGEYLAGVIGDDRLDSYVQYRADGTAFGRREVTDAPFTDWTRRSEGNIGNAADEAVLFTPTGRPYRMNGLSPASDYRVASDPWLASTTPTYLGNPGNPQSGTDLRPFGTTIPFNPIFPNAANYLDHRDWLQISNFAPDGRPVNLFNLRPNGSPVGTNAVAQNIVGGFGAEPGFGSSPRADGRQIRRMSNYLSLLNVAELGNPQSLIQAFDPTTTGTVWVPGHNDPQPIGLSGTEIQNTPAVWTMYQRFMLMPMNQPFAMLNRNGDESTWADPDYPPYQYADADGDGFSDSRWFELSTARDISAGNSNQSRDDIARLFNDADMRYFIAARAVDLSSMVNVNTATDQLVRPNAEFPLGSTPGEVDLRRLLTMQDAASNYASVVQGTSNAIPLSLSDAPRPYTPREDLASAYVWNGPERFTDFLRESQDYQYYQATVNDSGDLRLLDSDAPSMLIGRYAYAALRRALSTGGTLDNNYRGYNLEGGASATQNTDLLQFERDPQTGMTPTAEDRYNEFLRVGQQYAVTPGLSTSSAGLFGLDDLSELLTYHGLNDPDFTSRLERTVDARYDSTLPSSGFDDPRQTRRMSPLLSNRDLNLDRFSHSRILSYNDMRIAPSLENQTETLRIGEISRNAMALMALTPRKRLTTISGFVPLSPDAFVTDAAVPEAMQADSELPSLESLLSGSAASTQALFRLYAGALASELADMQTVGAWESDPTSFANYNYSSLFYGHRGPELALRAAAHAAVNMRDMTDPDNDPTIATLILDSNQTPDDLQDYAMSISTPMMLDGVDPENEREYQLFPGIVEGNTLDRVGELYPSGLPEGRQAVNVYGIEATPVITEVSMLYAFTDAPTGAGGDSDFNLSPIPNENPFRPGELNYPRREDVQQVTINTSVNPGNPDYLMQVLAVQLHNPYDEAISLGGKKYNDNPQDFAAGEPLTRRYAWDNGTNSVRPDQLDPDPNANYHFDYYLEYNGRFFKLAQYLEWYPADGLPGSYYNTDDPTTTPEYGTVPNPTSFPVNTGGQMPLTTAGGSFPDFITRNVVLQPGETRVFYAIADQRFDDPSDSAIPPSPDSTFPDDRWTRILGAWGDLPNSFTVDRNGDGLPDGPDGLGWTGPAEEWVNHQLGVVEGIATRTPVMMMSFNPTTGALLDTGSFEPLDQPPLSSLGFDASRTDAQEVRLWKKILTHGEESRDSDITNATEFNLIENDMLVDRMQVPASMASDWNGAQVEIEDTWSFREDFPVPGTIQDQLNARNDNTGITIADWVTTRRMDSPTQEAPSVGQVTPWMLRSRQNPLSLQIESRYLDPGNDRLTDAMDPNSFFSNGDDVGDPFVNPEYHADYEVTETMGEFFNYSRNPGGFAIVQTLALEPYAKSDVVTPYPDRPASFDDDAGNDSINKFPTMTIPSSGVANLDPTTGLPVPEIITEANTISERPRLADLLLAWGIGPTYAPNPNRAATVGQGLYAEQEWMTAGDAMAIALGVENPVPTGPDLVAADAVWADTWDAVTDPVNPVGVLDDGHLALDRFVPFLNQNTAENPIVFTPGDDRIRGAGVPAALGVIDRARVFDRPARVTDPVTTGTEFDLELALTRPVLGTININTAPVEVLRLLPGLAPMRTGYVNTSAGGSVVPEWWGSELTDTNVPTAQPAANSTPTQLIENPDIATGIVTYRDRKFAFPFTAASASAIRMNYFGWPLFTSVNDANVQSLSQNFLTEDAINNPGSSVVTRDRQAMTGIQGLRPTPGFGSLGELLAVRIDPEFETTDTSSWNFHRHMAIDMLGYDDRAQGIQDDTTIVPQVFGSALGEYEVGNTIDDYAEKLALANGVLNMLSVRSDFYAVWFVVQGYREADVANLRPEDPLIPSLHKRYLMVIDRSNVIEPGDEPKIVLLKEVPL
ncbi:MAG: hypothetical protein JJ916_05280 [Phycisphaerales bacterium]|nr:hypothetical protein [Phycisphaerales bacterium]